MLLDYIDFIPMANPVSEELLDVVDIDDQVTGTQTRGAIHAGGLMHRAAHVLVFNSADQLFLQKRSMSKDENPGLWDTSCAGHVDSGESYLQCAVRELFEELGIRSGFEPEYLFHIRPCERNGMEHSHIYRCRFDGELRLQPDEIEDGRWLHKAEVDALVDDAGSGLTDILRMIWSQYRCL